MYILRLMLLVFVLLNGNNYIFFFVYLCNYFLLLDLNYFIMKFYKYIGMVLRYINIIFYYSNISKLLIWLIFKIGNIFKVFVILKKYLKFVILI